MGFATVTFLSLSLSLPLSIPSPPQIAPLPRDHEITIRPVPQRVLHLDTLRATIRIHDATATTELEQIFNNPSNAPAEESYIWPLPEGASVSDFQLWIDGKPQKAELLDKDKARSIYEGIVRSQRDPAILEWAGLGCVRASVFPVPARGQARVQLKYTTLLDASANLSEYILPLRLAALSPAGIRSFTIEGAIESQRAIASIYSPTHALDVKQINSKSARFSYEGSGASQIKNFILTFVSPQSDFGALVLAHRAAGAPGFFTLSLTPRFDLAPSQILPKDVVFVFDTSGSMVGEKMEQAKKALAQCLGRLAPNDRFAMIRFSTEAEAFRPEICEITKDNIDAARAWVQKLEARGGTNIDEGLSEALRHEPAPGRMQMIFFLTDGLPTVGITDKNQLLNKVRGKNTKGLRIFTFGVGFDVNTQLLDALANESKAAREYVHPQEDVEMKVSALFDKVANPVLSDVAIDGGDADFFDIYPRQLPDLFRGSQLVVTGRYRGDGKKILKLSGKFGESKREFTYEVYFPRVEEKYDTTAALWASRKVGFLLDEIRLRGSNPELIDEIKRLGKEYNIITPYTSFLVVEENQRLASARGISNPRPGWGENFGGGRAGDRDAFDDEVRDSLRRLESLEKKDAGETAVEDSKNASDLASASAAAPNAAPATGGKSILALERRDGGRLAGAIRANTRNVGKRVFQNVNNVWVENTFTDRDKTNIVKIKFLSDDYFALIAKEPELASCFALGKNVVVQLKGAFYEVES